MDINAYRAALRRELEGLERSPDRPAKFRRMAEIRAQLGESVDSADSRRAAAALRDELDAAASDTVDESDGDESDWLDEPRTAADTAPLQRAVPRKGGR